MKKAMAFMKKHPVYHATIHALGGLGLGIIIAHYFSDLNLMLWGIILIIVAVIGHIYAWIA